MTGMSWATYGTWVYRVDYPPGADISVRSAMPRFVDVAFHEDYRCIKHIYNVFRVNLAFQCSKVSRCPH